jgi:hypothetical protein
MSTNSRNTDVEHWCRLTKITEKLLTDLMKHDDCWQFLKPVSKRAVRNTYNYTTLKIL